MSGSEPEEASLASAREAFRRDPGSASLAALGVWDLLDELADAEARAALWAVFRAHGRELGRSAALGCLMAHVFVAGEGLAPGSCALGIPRRSKRHGEVLVLVGEPSAEYVLVDGSSDGVLGVARANVELQPVAIPGRLPIHEFRFAREHAKVFLPERHAQQRRYQCRFFGQIAAAHEIVGAAEGALDLALDHAATRVQFGKPIGSFQAVRHLLAWARTDCAAALEVSRQLAAFDPLGWSRFGEITKAIAGRNARRICERSLQVLGGIGFTAEQDHHHFHSRVLALDSLLGSSAELTRGLGAWLRDGRREPRIPMHFLLDGAAS
jgi:hypothetical protein